MAKKNPHSRPRPKEEVAGIATTKRKAIFAKELAVSNNKYKAAAKAGISTHRANVCMFSKTPDVQLIVAAVRQELRNLSVLTMEEVKKLTAEISMVSVVDLTEEDGTIDLVKIKERGLGRFVKEFEQDVTVDSETGKKTITTKIKGYSRLDALKLLSTIQKDEESRDIQIVQAMAFLFQQHQELLKEKDRVFGLYAKKFNLESEYVEKLFEKSGQLFMLPSGEKKDAEKL